MKPVCHGATLIPTHKKWKLVIKCLTAIFHLELPAKGMKNILQLSKIFTAL